MDPNTQTSSVPEQPHSNHKLVALAIIGAVLLAFVFLVITLRSKNKPPTQPNATDQQVSPSVEVGKGSMSLQPTQQKTSYKVGESIVLTLYASSDDKSVAGYDAVVQFDPTLASFTSAKSLVTDFQAPISRKGTSDVSLFSFKKLSSEAPTVFTDTPVLEVTFKALKAGTQTFNLQYTPGSTRDSNLMDEGKKPKDLLGSVDGTIVTIAQ